MGRLEGTCTHGTPIIKTLLGLLVLIALTMSREATVLAQDTESAVCGAIREPFMFWLWRTMAGSPEAKRVAQIADLEPIRFKTRDGIELGGYKLSAMNPKGYLLVAQGNAMLADHLVGDLQIFRDLGLDVYIFDYRGYGLSQGKSRLLAITADYREVVSHLNNQAYDKRLLYGISMGGVILLNAVGQSASYTRLVVDSSPGRISGFGCPERFDPVGHLPKDGSRTMIISGARDGVVTPSQMEEMIRIAGARGARVFRDEEFAHPYQDSSAATHRRRQNEVAAFLLGE